MTFNLENLKAQFPAEYAAVFAAGRAAGRAAGVAAERDRVAGHLRAAELSGARALATAAIRDGRDVAALSNAYLTAGLQRRDQNARAEDELMIAEAADGARSTATTSDSGFADRVADIVCEGLNQ